MPCTNTRRTAGISGMLVAMEPAQDVTIYSGSLVANATGKAVPATKAEDQPAIGMAYAVEPGRVTIERGAHLWDNDATNPVTAAHIGSNCYIVDDCTVTALATGSSIAGKVLGIEDDQVIVETL